MSATAARILAAFTLISVLAGGPVGLVALGQIRGLPGGYRGLLRMDDGSLALTALTLVGWLAWSSFVATILCELTNSDSGRKLLGTLPMIGPVRWLGVALIGATLSMPATSWSEAPTLVHSVKEQALGPNDPDAPAPEALEANPALKEPASTLIAARKVGKTVKSPGVAPSGADEDQGRWPDTKTRAARENLEQFRSHVVEPGEDLWSLAEAHLGDGKRWRELVTANPNTLTGELPDPRPGMILRIPRTFGTEEAPQPTRAQPVGQEDSGQNVEAATDDSDSTGHSGSIQPETGLDFHRQDDNSFDSVRNESSLVEADIAPSPVAALTAGIGVVLAAGLVAGLRSRRLRQLHSRRPGRKVGFPLGEVRRLETALGIRGDIESLCTVELALERVGSFPGPASSWSHMLVAGDQVALTPERPGLPAPGFTEAGETWRSTRGELQAGASYGSGTARFPATVCLGETDDGESVLVDLESQRLLTVSAPDQDLRLATIRAIATELACSKWSAGVRLFFVGSPTDAPVGDAVQPTQISSQAEALDLLRRSSFGRVASKLKPKVEASVTGREPGVSDAWLPEVYVFSQLVDSKLYQAVSELLAATPAAPICAVLALPAPPPNQTIGTLMTLHGDLAQPRAELAPQGVEFVPQVLTSEVATALHEMYDGGEVTTPAPWWYHETPDGRPAQPRRAVDPLDTDPGYLSTQNQEVDAAFRRPEEPGVNTAQEDVAVTPTPPSPQAPTTVAHHEVHGAPASAESTSAEKQFAEQGRWGSVSYLPPSRAAGAQLRGEKSQEPAFEYPTVLLMGPIELRGAAGDPPMRATNQLIEYCAWLLENPGLNGVAMADALVIAEGTRRSNISRLRAWLGAAPDGTPYLPVAYSGRVTLHHAVSSDWQRLQILLKPGVNRLGIETLVTALKMVRGAPLANAAPGQWHWAEEMRTDIASTIRDIGVVLAEQALAIGDLDLARWATSRALKAAPEDELLLCMRIQAEHRAGNAAEVERLALRMTRQARLLDVDLNDETVVLLQQVMEGQQRARG